MDVAGSYEAQRLIAISILDARSEIIMATFESIVPTQDLAESPMWCR
jgi:hypothetical protein